MRYFVILLLIVFTSLGYCQKLVINGSVKDSETGVPLPYVNIQVKNTNLGTITNLDGQFKIILEQASYYLTFSLMGYSSQTINVNSSQTVEISLHPIAYEMGEVTANNLTWAEKYILDSIELIKEKRKELHYFNADAYSKTSFFFRHEEVIGLVEAISRIQFLEPDLHKEKLTVLKVSPNLKNMPYRIIAVNQTINLMNTSSKIWNFSIINPLSDKALNYYNVSFKRKTRINNDTVVVLSISPKEINAPLFEGDLYFLMNSHQLIEADLHGNQLVKDATFDSLKVYQKYSFRDSVFNLPVFTKFSLNMNIMGLKFKYRQEYTFANFSINKEGDKPIISEDNSVIDEPNLDLNLDFERDEMFKVPLTETEEKFNKMIVERFVNAPFYKKILFYLFTNAFPIMVDEPSDIAGLKFSKFSNLYHFNKVESHYLGYEYTLFNNDITNLYTRAGFSFGAKEFEFDLNFHWRQFALSFWDNITNLGGFDYIHTLHTINALFSHEDDLNYYKSVGAEIKCSLPLSSKLSVVPFFHFEKQYPIGNSTEFSFFNRDGAFKDNFKISEYSNNKVGVKIEYTENPDYWGVDKLIFHGQSFTNIFASIEAGNNNILGSDANTTEWNVEIVRYQEIYDPIKIELQCGFRFLNGAALINNMRFVNKAESYDYQRNALTLNTLNNYDYYLKDFIIVKADMSFFRFPQFLGLNISFGGFYTFLRSLDPVDLNISFIPLTSNFHEYGVSLKGISMINIYFLKNNFNPKDIYVRFYFSF